MLEDGFSTLPAKGVLCVPLSHSTGRNRRSQPFVKFPICTI
jgi:hypothetical protein